MELDGYDLVEVARDHGTPTHVASKRRLLDNCERVSSVFGAALHDCEVFYSYKTNCVPGLLRLIHDQGIGAEVISPYELWLAIELGLPGRRIIYNGPHKSKESLGLAIGNDLKLINADSMSDLMAIAEVCRTIGRSANIGLRLCPRRGWNAQFGFQMHNGEAAAGLRFIAENEAVLKLKGIHLHLGSQIGDRSVFGHALDEALAFMSETGAMADGRIEYLDLGGGYPVPTVRDVGGLERRICRLLGRPWAPPRPGSLPNLSDVAAIMAATLRRYTDGMARPPTVIVEPGRAITSGAQILLLAVRALKPRAPPIAILDGGKMNITVPTSFEFHHVLAANRMREPSLRNYRLVGRTCTPSDLVYDAVRLPELSEGDVLAVMDAGAYFTSFSSDFAYPRPPVLLADAGSVTVLRDRESFVGIAARDRVDSSPARPAVVA
ncbi:MAG: hypothetical protein HKM95_03445 [Inquilinus sp.]|nr:hypothetical protein [Inquilinus sp.]